MMNSWRVIWKRKFFLRYFMTGSKDNAVEENQSAAAARRAKGEFVRGVSGFRGTLVQVIFPQCQADIIFMLPLIALGAIE